MKVHKQKYPGSYNYPNHTVCGRVLMWHSFDGFAVITAADEEITCKNCLREKPKARKK